MSKDYYKVLGVTEFDDAENIKLAYRKLARKLHPDIAGNTEDAIKRFKEINEAYDVLSNKVKKEEYDRARKFYSYATKNNSESNKTENKTTNPQRKQEKNNGFSFDWESFVAKRKREDCYKKDQVKSPKRGEDIYTEIEITVLESISGCIKSVNMLQTIVCEKCNGRKFVNGAQCKSCNGKGEHVFHKKFNVRIPAGIKNKSKIRLAGEGQNGLNGGKNGDLYIIILVKENQEYKTEGLNITKIVPVTPFEAVLGCEIKLNTLNGKVNVKIPPETQNGQKIRLSGCGIVQNDKIGDMIITVEIKIPHNLSQQEKDLYKKLAECSTGNIRDEFYGQQS